MDQALSQAGYKAGIRYLLTSIAPGQAYGLIYKGFSKRIVK